VPNGHGGVPRFGSPILLLLVLSGLFWLRSARDVEWTLYPALFGAALLAWRLAWHTHLYGVLAYGGAYTPYEVLRAARKRHLITLLILLPALLVTTYFAWV
jgi:hypothetical protein